MMSGRYEYDLMATRRKDPDYEQVSGYVHKDLALKFRIICMTERLTQSDALEQALRFWIEFKNLKDSQQNVISNSSESERTNDSPTETAPSPATKAKRGKASKEAS
jgi:hypothetical protein